MLGYLHERRRARHSLWLYRAEALRLSSFGFGVTLLPVSWTVDVRPYDRFVPSRLSRDVSQKMPILPPGETPSDRVDWRHPSMEDEHRDAHVERRPFPVRRYCHADGGR